jgi:tRNA 2-thiouridine synthesizing protein A
MHNGDADILVDITGLTCPIPLIKARRAIKKASKGQTIKFIGTDKEKTSRKEILIAISHLNQPLLEDHDHPESNGWHVLIKKV